MKYYIDEENKIYYKVTRKTHNGVTCTTIYDDDSATVEDAQIEEVLRPIVFDSLKEIDECEYQEALQRHVTRLKKLIRGK